MKTVFIIGGLGSGKSTVAQMLAEWGAFAIDLDEIGHEVLKRDDVKQALVDAFGEGVIDASGDVDRAALAFRAFASEESTALLNGITVPHIVGRFREILEEAGASNDIAVVEASAYRGPDNEYAVLADEVVAVIADPGTRLRRAVAKGFDEADVRNRMDRQPTDEQRRLWADHVIVNEGDEGALRAAVQVVWERIRL